MAKVKTFEQFVEDLRNVWGDRYTVSPNGIYKDVTYDDKDKLISEIINYNEKNA